MKIYRILCVCAVIAFPQATLAERESGSQSMEIVHAVIDFCSQVDPANASKYQNQSKAMFHEVSAHAERDRDDKGGRNVDMYDQTRAALAKIPKQNAVSACRGFLE